MAESYSSKLKALLAMQRKSIDDTAPTLDAASARAFNLVVLLGVLVVLIGATFGPACAFPEGKPWGGKLFHALTSNHLDWFQGQVVARWRTKAVRSMHLHRVMHNFLPTSSSRGQLHRQPLAELCTKLFLYWNAEQARLGQPNDSPVTSHALLLYRIFAATSPSLRLRGGMSAAAKTLCRIDRRS